MSAPRPDTAPRERPDPLTVTGGAMVYASLLGLFVDVTAWPGWAVALGALACLAAAYLTLRSFSDAPGGAPR